MRSLPRELARGHRAVPRDVFSNLTLDRVPPSIHVSSVLGDFASPSLGGAAERDNP
jgi:hypothetical protein